MESPLEVERVEWVPSTAEALEVRLAGRWRRAAPGDPIELLVDDGGERRRFRAVGVDGGADGEPWTARFAVPVELRARLAARLALSAGGRELSLPAASPGPADESAAPPAATVVEPQVLAERRARREGMADEALLRRAQAAEATVQTLETQLALLEERLREAGTREDAARLEQEVVDLRLRLEAAEGHAAALAAEMDEIRREGAEAQAAADAARAAAEAERAKLAEGLEAQVQAELDRLRGEAASLQQLLQEERAARGEAEQRLTLQADRVAEVEATVTLLEHELDRRTRIQTAVQVELEELREALVRVRAEAEAAACDDGARVALEELKVTAAGLRERVDALEAAERAARAELRDARAELEARERELARARADLERAQAEASAARVAEEARAGALRDAERTLATVRREAAELQARLDEERRRRFEVEASLKAELERERERFGGYVAEVEGELRARIAAERRAFEEQAASIETLVAELRGRLAHAGAELEDRLAGERRLRDAAVLERDEALAERDAAREEAAQVKREVAADLERAAAEREQLVGRMRDLERRVAAARADVEREVADARAAGERRVAEVRAELEARLAEAEAERERLAAVLADRERELEELRERAEALAERDAAVGALVADVVALGAALREGVERSLGELSARIDAEVASLRAELEEERTQRWVAEQELAAERERGATGLGASSAVAESLARAELEAARRELAAAQEQLAAERARSADAGETASRLVADLEAAEARLKERERGEEPGEADAVAAGDEADAAGGAGERAATDAEGATGPAVGGDAASSDSAGDGAAGDDAETGAASGSAEADAGDRAATGSATSGGAPGEGGAAGGAGRVGALVSPTATTEPRSSEAQLLPIRPIPPGQRRVAAWLAPAIARLAERDEEAAARLLVELLPAQGGLVKSPVTYGLTIDGQGTFRVVAGPHEARVDVGAGPGLGDARVHLAGPIAALAPLAAGGARRRLRDVRVEGRKRRLRKLLKARRAPVDLAELVDRRIELSPELALAALAAAVDPAWTAGQRFGVVYALSGGPALEVLVADGEPLRVEPADRERTEPPAATVSLNRVALLPLLTRATAPSGERALVAGDADAVARLHAWFDRAQGLPERS